MAVTYIGASNSSNEAHVSSRSVSKPAGAQVGVAFVTFWIGNDENPEAVTPPAGWVLRDDVSDGTERTLVYLKYVDGDATSTSYSWSWEILVWSTIQAVFFDGVDAGLDFETVPFDSAAGSGLTFSTTSVSTSAGAGLAWSGNTQDYSAATTHTPPTGFTETDDASGAAAAYRIATGASESAADAGVDPGVASIAVLVAVAPASANVEGAVDAALPGLAGALEGDVEIPSVEGAVDAALPAVTGALAGTSDASSVAPIAAYNFDEESGPVVDVTGNGHGFSLAGGATRTSDGNGHTGRGLHASTADVAAGPPVFGETAERTLMMWVKTTGGFTGWVFQWKDTGIPTGQWGLLSLFGDFGFRARNSGGTTGFASISRPTDDAYHHFAGTYDGSVVRLYVDGELAATSSTVSGGIAAADEITAHEVDQGGVLDYDEVYVFDVALDEATIQSLMATPPSEGPPDVEGAVDAALPALTGGIDGVVSLSGAAAATLPALAGDLEGVVGDVASGSVDAALPALTGSLDGVLDVGGSVDAALPALSAALAGTSDATAGPFVTGVSANGRYFVDADGDPILVRADSPWAMFTKLSPIEVDTYLSNRASYGVNLCLVSMVGAEANGGPDDNGETYDGVLPFVGGDPTAFNETYWTRMDSYIAKARAAGVGLLIYPMDGWNTTWGDTVFNPGAVSNTDCQTYGQTLATRYADEPHILWAFGGDYNEDETINARFNACLTGIRAAGDTRLVTIQLLYETSESSESAYWEPKVDFDFVYTYYVTYKGVSDSYGHTWSVPPTPKPALFCEGAYENSFQPHPGTDEVIRRQACWALTSGSPGDFTGQEGVWNFQSSWETLLDTTAADQLKAIRDTFDGIEWWTLVPDESSQLVTAGRGSAVTDDSAVFPASNDYVTAARSVDGSLAVIYLPDASSAITVDDSKIGANPTATWVDPCTGATTAATPGTAYSRGDNSDGDTDWLLILTGDPITVEGAVDGALPGLTATAAGDASTEGAVAAALPALTGDVGGETSAEGAADAALPALTGDLTGAVAGSTGGAIDAALPFLTGDLSGASDADSREWTEPLGGEVTQTSRAGNAATITYGGGSTTVVYGGSIGEA